ncbi:Uncharacterised protein [Cellulomonas fimi]|nr:Uncharacterised protein [Cellulomonas fimi]
MATSAAPPQGVQGTLDCLRPQKRYGPVTVPSSTEPRRSGSSVATAQ